MTTSLSERLRHSMERVILGKREVIDQVLTAFLAGGHVLLEDIPGVGKTMLARALARSLGLEFRRIQFTSDLLPADILGVSVFQPADGSFTFQPGPIFAQVILADELNRTPPRTQSSLLEALEDARVSVDGLSHDLPRPFFVVATQNPLEFAGTYPLPESELDRFLLCTRVGYPDAASEAEILRLHRQQVPLDTLEPVGSVEEVEEERRLVGEVRVEDSLTAYLLEIVTATRNDDRLRLGASPRASLALERAARARARLQGRDYCVPDDIKDMVVPVLAHRLLPMAGGGSSSRDQAARILTDLLERIPVPA